ncbi:hypothetical protein Tco_0401640 [Tanacetum coccineum]
MITSTPRTPNLEDTKAESSAQRKLMVIRFRLPPIRQDPKTPIPTPTEVDVNNLAKTIQISIVAQRSLEDLEALQNVEQVKEHMKDEELDQLLDGIENVDEDEFMDTIFNSQEDADTRIEPISDKESLEAEKDADMNVTNDDEGEELAGDKFELRRREKVKGIEETKETPPPTPIRSPRTHIAPLSSDKETFWELTVIIEDAPSSTDKEKLKELTVTDPSPSSSTHSSSSPKPKTGHFRRCKSFIHQMGGCYGLLLERQKTQADVAAMIAKAIQKEHDNLRTEVISQVNDVIANHIPPHVYSFLRYYMSKNILHVHPTQPTRSSAQDLQHQLYLMMRDDEQLYHDDYQDDDARPERESSAKRQKTSKHGTYSLGESSSGQAMEQDPNPSGSGTQEQIDDIDAWMEDVGTDDDEVPDDKVSQELLEEIASVIWERAYDFQLGIESYQQKVNLTAPASTFLPCNEKRMNGFTINSRNCLSLYAYIKEGFEGLKSIKKSEVYGYANLIPCDDDAKYLRFYEEDIKECLKHRDQTRRWEMYVNGRPLRSRRDRPE